ncbi:MAG: hypothetical protein EPO32_08665 [Anaerolineae bacterium]|nr:MAG: hypothetical protein EPO32_08665 [Anaerolineae bacterium]
MPLHFTPGLKLIAGPPSRAAARLERLAAGLALRGPVRMLVCGNRFDPYELAYIIAHRSGDYHEILDERITLARAETAHQWLSLLQHTPADGVPALVGDLLAPLHDEDLPVREADDLLFQGLRELRRVWAACPVVASAAPGPARSGLFAVLRRECATVRIC